jgi:hypothetical protein
VRRIRRELHSTDPQRRAILSRLRAIYRRLPANGRLVFFDIKPIAVKAYGGRRLTSERVLVLNRKQKTRGFFYLFLSYDVISGKVVWAFLPKKDAIHVCWFMNKLRQHYKDMIVWVALDQDPAHPCKSRRTRELMRRLKLHWISLPKGSPDDNPAETVFSTIEQMILQCSNDPDVKTTQRRISRLLTARNRRADRFISVPYLGDSHKH